MKRKDFRKLNRLATGPLQLPPITSEPLTPQMFKEAADVLLAAALQPVSPYLCNWRSAACWMATCPEGHAKLVRAIKRGVEEALKEALCL